VWGHEQNKEKGRRGESHPRKKEHQKRLAQMYGTFSLLNAQEAKENQGKTQASFKHTDSNKIEETERQYDDPASPKNLKSRKKLGKGTTLAQTAKSNRGVSWSKF